MIDFRPSDDLLQTVPALREQYNHYVRERKRQEHAPDDQRILLAEKYLRGRGLEVGAFHSPIPVPGGVLVDYTDRYSEHQLKQWLPESRDRRCVFPIALDDGEKLATFPDASYDFAIASHMIEHVQDVIQAVRNHVRVTKPGGVLFYAVPDKRFTFDKKRPLTTTQHIIDDYVKGPQHSHREHLIEYFSIVDELAGDALDEQVESFARSGRDIHFHVWTPDTFKEQIELFCQRDLIPCQHLETVQNGWEFITVLRTKRIWN